MKKAVLFDLDGTLINSLADMAAACNYALEKHGFPLQPEVERFKVFVGDGVPKLMERILPPEAVSEETIQMMRKTYVERYLEHCTEYTRPYDGILEMLEVLRENGLTAAVVSNKPQEQSERILCRIFPENSFAVIAGNRPGFHVKPDPSLTLWTMGRLDVQPDECFFVGDSGVDMITARKSGATGVGVLWGFRSRQELTEAGADALAETPAALAALLCDPAYRA